MHFLFPALPIPKNKKHGMKQIINTISHILRRKAGSEILIPYTAYFVFMPFLQPFYGEINLFIPRYILIQPQTISVGTTYQTIKIFFCSPVFLNVLHSSLYGFFHKPQLFLLLPDSFLFILQHTEGIFQIHIIKICPYLFHGKAQLKQIPNRI